MLSFEDYQKQIDGWFGNFGKEIANLGKILLDAKSTLQVIEWERLNQCLLNRGLTQADIKAAVAVAEGKIDGRLFFVGAQSSKILNLSHIDQKRLLAGEKFGIKQPNHEDIVEKTWSEMTAEEKNQLLGPKGGQILTAIQQKPSSRKPMTSTMVHFDGASYLNQELFLTFGNKTGKIPIGALVQAIMEKEQFAEFIKDVFAKQKQMQSTAA